MRFNVKLAVSHTGYSMQGFNLLVLRLIISQFTITGSGKMLIKLVGILF